jgi:hypothetical protein
MSRAAEALQAHGEVLKVARLLQREPETLAYLEALSVSDLQELRERLTETVFDAHVGSLRRLAAASRLLPVGLSASMGESVFGALLSARLTGLLDPERAAQMAAKLPAPFLADVAVEMDPRRASEMIARIGADQIAQITVELMARGEYVTMGRFVGHLSDEALTAALESMDDRSLLGVVFVLEDKSQLPGLVARLPEWRVAGVIQAAADNNLWVQALDLLDHLLPEQRDAMVAATLQLDRDALDAIVAAVIEHDLWEEVLPIAEHDAAVQAALAARMTALPARQRTAVMRRVRETGGLGREAQSGRDRARST